MLADPNNIGYKTKPKKVFRFLETLHVVHKLFTTSDSRRLSRFNKRQGCSVS